MEYLNVKIIHILNSFSFYDDIFFIEFYSIKETLSIFFRDPSSLKQNSILCKPNLPFKYISFFKSTPYLLFVVKHFFNLLSLWSFQEISLISLFTHFYSTWLLFVGIEFLKLKFWYKFGIFHTCFLDDLTLYKYYQNLIRIYRFKVFPVALV